MDKIKRAADIIQDLERHGPAGLIHIDVLSNIIEKPIQIWNANGSLNRIIGKGRRGQSIDIEYHAADSGQIGQLLAKEASENPIFHPYHSYLNFHPIHFLNPSLGHWTLKCGKDPDNIPFDLNSCLFSVIGSQIGRNPSELRQWTILNLKSNFWKFADWIDKILRLWENGEIILMIGGARYCGTSPEAAKIILDRSQDEWSHGFERGHLGHSRGHAVYASGYSIVDYSQNSMKTGFQSRADQDYVTHLALSTRRAQNAMKALNDGSISEGVRIPSSNLRNSTNLPQVVRYENGRLVAQGDMTDVILVLRHQRGQFRNPDADVFVQTCYPLMA
ncbi:uncharacterized protein LOC112637070 [Camponotus floridanus]|nr:uncharacterized protein LOC112637070 [Camponotus floridanus]